MEAVMSTTHNNAKSQYDRKPLENLPPPSYAQATVHANTADPVETGPRRETSTDSHHGGTSSIATDDDNARTTAERAQCSNLVEDQWPPGRSTILRSGLRTGNVGMASSLRSVGRCPERRGILQGPGGRMAGRMTGRFEALTGGERDSRSSVGDYEVDDRDNAEERYDRRGGGGVGRANAGLLGGRGLGSGGEYGGGMWGRRSVRQEASIGVLGRVSVRREGRRR